jgi:hypothetical protein
MNGCLSDMEVRVMRLLSFDRGIVVAICFSVWIGAAGLICWALVPKELPDESSEIVNPAAIVRAEPAPVINPEGQMPMAQR